MAKLERTREAAEKESRKAGAQAGLEGAAEHPAGVVRREGVEGGEELSIGGGPPSAAGGTPGSGLDTEPPRRA